MCNKTDLRIECYKCGYSGSEARWLDTDPPMDCNTTREDLNKYLDRINPVPPEIKAPNGECPNCREPITAICSKCMKCRSEVTYCCRCITDPILAHNHKRFI
jgi:hypothetical protein